MSAKWTRKNYSQAVAGKPKIGVLALQGDFAEHLAVLNQLGAEASLVRTADEIQQLDGLILPGGESTVIGKLMVRHGADKAIQQKAKQGMAVFGTCAGAILMAKEIENSDQPSLGLMNIAVRRNAFGRQIDSFETDLEVKGLNGTICAVFIRAPIILKTDTGVETLSVHDNKIVVVRQGRFLASSFHPEVAGETRLHQMFLNLINTQ